MEEDEQSVAGCPAGDERSPVGKDRPAPLDERDVGFGKHLTLDEDVGRHHEAEERARPWNGAHRLRLLPGQRAAERAPALPETHRDQRWH